MEKEEFKNVGCFFECPECKKLTTSIFNTDVILNSTGENKGLEYISCDVECLDCGCEFTVEIDAEIKDINYEY